MCCSLSKHSVKTIDESTVLVRLHYVLVLTYFVWNVYSMTISEPHHLMHDANLVKPDMSQLHSPYLISLFFDFPTEVEHTFEYPEPGVIAITIITIDISLGFTSWA